MKVMLDEGAFMPERKHIDDDGLDLKTPIHLTIAPNSRVFVNTGVHIEPPVNTVSMIKSRSGLNKDKGVQCEGVVDENYRGPIGIVLYNHSNETVQFNRGDRIAQLVVLPCFRVDLELVDKLGDTDRGEGGFGSTGVG